MSPKIKLASPRVFSTYTPISRANGTPKSKNNAPSSFSSFANLNHVNQKKSQFSQNKESPKTDIEEITKAINGINIKMFSHSKLIKNHILSKPEGDIEPVNPSLECEQNAYICLCGKMLLNTSATLCDDCIISTKTNEMSGYLYMMDTNTNNLDRKFGVVQGKDIFLYENATNLSKPLKIISLVDSYIAKNCFLSLSLKGKQFFGFQVSSSKNYSINFYTETNEDKTIWINTIMSIVGNSNINEFYDMKAVLGKGRFGVVREAIHRVSGTHVAVKGLVKSKMSQEDLEMIRREIEILKICNHPNIIKLYDYFETEQYVFMIIDLLYGSDLVNYFVRYSFSLKETTIAHIAIQLIRALEYTHSLGIMHRDIKGENILVSDFTATPVIKLSDFGLSRIIGSNEKCTDSYGTLGYAAPELYLQKSYDKSVDIWGLGVVIYSLLSKGQMPFDAATDKDVIWYKLIQENCL